MNEDRMAQTSNRTKIPSGLNFANGIYRTDTRKIIIVHQWLPKLQLFYGLWVKEQKVVYIDEWGVVNDDRCGKLEKRRLGRERI